MGNALIGAELTRTYSATELAADGRGFGLGDNYTDHNGKGYKFVLFDNGTGNVAAVAGNMCYYKATVANTYVVTSDLSDGNGIGAGMFMSVPADGEYCWIQTTGPATLTTALTAGADGNALTAVGATDGTLDVSAAVTDFICAVADDISEKTVILCCPR